MNLYLDNILFYLQRSGGGSVYWGELTKRFAVNNQNVSFIEPNATTSNIIYSTLNLQPVLLEKKMPVSVLRYLPVTVSMPAGSVFHSSYYRFANQKDVINILTVHDFIYEYYRKGMARYVHTKQKAKAAQQAKGIVCISESTKRDLLKFYPSVASKNIQVIYNGVSDDYSHLPDEELVSFEHYSLFKKHKYLLFIGHRTSYKNFDFAVQLVSGLSKDYKLAIVGNSLESMEQELLTKCLKDRYLFLGNISNEQLNKVYNLSFCLIYPSSYEGFGIPILEAYRSGCSVLALNVSAIPEIAGESSLLVDRLDTNLFTKQIQSLENINLQAELKESGYVRSLKFSWDRCFNELNNFYEYNK